MKHMVCGAKKVKSAEAYLLDTLTSYLAFAAHKACVSTEKNFLDSLIQKTPKDSRNLTSYSPRLSSIFSKHELLQRD